MKTIETRGMVKGLKLRTLKASNLKGNKRNYWVRKGVHVNYSGGYYIVTTLYNSSKFKYLYQAKEYIKEGNYLLAYFA
jgi:hypothetical protein